MRRLFVAVSVAVALLFLTFVAQELTLPNRADSVKFAVLIPEGASIDAAPLT